MKKNKEAVLKVIRLPNQNRGKMTKVKPFNKVDLTLTHNEEDFCYHYVMNRCNGTDAILAAYQSVKSKKSAAAMASRLLNKLKVQDRIKELRKDIEASLGISPSWMAQEIIKIGDKSKDDRFKLECLKALAELVGYKSNEKVQVVVQQNNLFQETADEFKKQLEA